MTTTKQRINISIPKHTRDALKYAAKRDEMPEATKAARLLEFALELEEDRYFEKLANKRLTKKARWVPDNDKIWK
tara:strand:+ start:167 stop:391 length:225 start_codon:yes stop_codon:yes gene_type:complete